MLQILPHLVGQAAVEGLAVALVRGAPARRDGCQDAVGPRRSAGDRMAAGIDEQQSAPILVLKARPGAIRSKSIRTTTLPWLAQ